MRDDCVCQRCGDEYHLRAGKEPSDFCDECAQSISYEAIVLLARIVSRNGVTTRGVKQIKDWLKTIGKGTSETATPSTPSEKCPKCGELEAENARLREVANVRFEDRCDGCWTIGAVLKKVHVTNGALMLCEQCLGDINRKNPRIPELESALAAEREKSDALECTLGDEEAAHRDTLRLRDFEREQVRAKVEEAVREIGVRNTHEAQSVVRRVFGVPEAKEPTAVQ